MFSTLLLLNAPVADDMKLYAVPHYMAGNIISQSTHQLLNHGRSEIADRTALYTNRVVVMPNPRQTVFGSSVRQIQPANQSALHQKLDRAEDGGPPHTRQVTTDLLRRKPVLLVL